MPIIETPYEGMVAIAEDLITDISYHAQCYDTSTSRSNAGYHLTELLNKVSDLKTWHSSYDAETGTIEWERDEV